MDDFEQHLNKKMQDPEFKASWEALEADYSLINTLVKARNSAGLTQQQLSDKIGINQAVLSRIETGKANPSVETLKKLAKGLGKKLIIDFQ